MLGEEDVNIKTKTVKKYTIDEYLAEHDISQNELGRQCGVEPRNMTARKKDGSFVVVSSGEPYLMPKRFKEMFE